MRVIALHTDSIFARGGEKYIFEILSRLSKKYTVILYLERVSNYWRRKYQKKGITIYTLWTPKKFYWFSLPLKILINFFQVRGILVSSDVVYATNFPLSLLAVIVSKKTVVHCFEPLPIFYDKYRILSLSYLSRKIVQTAGLLYRPLDMYSIKKCKILTTLNEAVDKHIVTVFGKKADFFVKNGVDTDFFKPSKSVKNNNSPFIVIGHSTDYTVFKGTELLIKAIGILKQRKIKNIKLYISESIYDRETYDRYLHLIKNLKLEKYIFFVGRLDERDMVKFYQKMDVFCYTGSPYSAGGSTASLSVNEAQSCGIPVLRTLGTEDEIINNKTGMYFRDYTPEGIANIISTFVHLSPYQRKNMSKLSRDYTKKNFSWDSSVKVLDKIIYNISV